MKVFCVCGIYIFQKDMEKHLKSAIHFKRLQIISDFTDFTNNLEKREQKPNKIDKCKSKL